MLRFKSVVQYLSLILAVLIYGIMGAINNQARVFEINSFAVIFVLFLLSLWTFGDHQPGQSWSEGLVRSRALLLAPVILQAVATGVVLSLFRDAVVPELPLWLNLLSLTAAALAGWQYLLLARR